MIPALLQADPGAGSGGHDAATVSAAMERVLARRGGPDSDPFAKLGEWLVNHLGERGAGIVGDVLTWVFLAAVVYGALRFSMHLARSLAMRRSREGATGTPEPTAGALERARALLAEARGAREDGEFRLALQRLLYALVLALGGQGSLEFRDSWTTRELLVRGRPGPRARSILQGLVAELEAKEFGHVPIGAQDLDRVEGLCAEALGDEA